MSAQLFAERMRQLGPSPSHTRMAEVRALRATGVEVIDFSGQEATPRVAREAAARFMNGSDGGSYCDTRGLASLRQAIAAKLGAENAIAADPESDIVVTVGAKQAILAALLALVGPGDEVILEDPGYVSFEPLVRLVGATPVPIGLSAADEFRFPVDALARSIGPRTRLLLLCNPHNPCGVCRSAEELQAIADIVGGSDLTVLVDEAYEHFVYAPARHISFAALPAMRDCTVTVHTMSKIYNMSGWRIGWASGPAAIISRMQIAHTHSVSGPTGFAQAGAEAAIRAGLGEGDRPIASIVADYRERRDAMVDGLNRIAGVRCHRPQGAFFAFPDIRALGLGADALCERLLREAGIAAVPGGAFGHAGEGHVRFVFKAPLKVVRFGMERLTAALAAIGGGAPGDPSAA